MSLPLRYHVAIALVGLNVVSTTALLTFVYRASSESLEAQATRAVDVAAREREQALVRVLEQRQDRMRAFLGSVESLCGERTPRGTFAFERECVRVSLGGFQTAEHADAADLSYGTRLLARRGTWPQGSPFVPAGQLASVAEGSGRSYAMRAALGRLAIRVRFPIDDLSAIFQDRSGLDASGEVFLTDQRGLPLIPESSAEAMPAGLGRATQPCLAGTADQLHVNDDGTNVIAAFRPVPAL